ncbi:hypothetical protein K0B96_11160 [Horticoccus luteus]|uniref:Oligogalacturonide lyase n=1 Tax=Horticoccus luteus TaxID=2862869 RepID=A0A8F9TTM5_9BACT|nr:hypothetical protein [Horticoccus luteus]QYM77877.1 hypothetical protein K0B96_11160 [Horticoccus luteus]
MSPFLLRRCAGVSLALLLTMQAFGHIGDRFPAEKKIVVDPVTGAPLSFLTSQPRGDSKIYQTHHQWTSDGQWVVFRSNRVRGQAMAVNEHTGDIVQVTEHGYSGMLCLADHSMNLYFVRLPESQPPTAVTGAEPATPAVKAGESHGAAQIVRVDLGKLFLDSAAGTVGPATDYEHVCGVVPSELGAVGDVALDCTEDYAYFRVAGRDVAQRHLAPGTKLEPDFGPRHMGAGPTGLASMNLHTGEVKFIVAVPFQIGHVQTNPWVPGEIVFCWETGGKAPQRTWTVRADGTGLRPLYPEASYDWVTHEAVITKDEVAMALMGHRPVGTDDAWGACGTREHPTGLAIVNLRTREMRIVGQTATGSGFWHVNGSPDGRWACGDDFARNLWLIDRHTGEMILLTTGHKETAADHIHPTFSADSTRIEFQSAMLSADNRTMNICVVPVPAAWLQRTYSTKLP